MIGLLRRGFDEEVTAGGLTDALRRHAADVAVDDVENLAISLERVLRAVPDALATALAMSKDPRCGASVAFATGPILNYVLDEEDLLPEASFGALGLLDDAYLVHVFVAMLRQTYPYVETPAAYATPEQHTLEMVASLLPEGVAHALQRTCESTIHVAQAMFSSVRGEVTADSVFHPEIRVGEAVRVARAAPVHAE
jgi:uncharacterized membrane protein YkvA (DUF1232 family)